MKWINTVNRCSSCGIYPVCHWHFDGEFNRLIQIRCDLCFSKYSVWRDESCENSEKVIARWNRLNKTPENLKNCPICGNLPILIYWSKEPLIKKIECKNCDLMMYQKFVTEANESLIERWNRRKNEI